MGIKGVMTPEELIKLLDGELVLDGELQAKIVGNYAHLYGYVEGIGMVRGGLTWDTLGIMR